MIDQYNDVMYRVILSISISIKYAEIQFSVSVVPKIYQKHPIMCAAVINVKYNLINYKKFYFKSLSLYSILAKTKFILLHL